MSNAEHIVAYFWSNYETPIFAVNLRFETSQYMTLKIKIDLKKIERHTYITLSEFYDDWSHRYRLNLQYRFRHIWIKKTVTIWLLGLVHKSSWRQLTTRPKLQHDNQIMHENLSLSLWYLKNHMIFDMYVKYIIFSFWILMKITFSQHI